MSVVTINAPQDGMTVPSNFMVNGVDTWPDDLQVVGVLQQIQGGTVVQTFPANTASTTVNVDHNNGGAFTISFQGAPAGQWFLKVAIVQHPDTFAGINITVTATDPPNV